ncbi:hypothetical protein GPA27_19495 [Aromatoleum toluolicum]|uniref:Uncharacterized protein n=1 Tax=Aromatoleum toluolicum TaxID=90060 RepID=A0ABX1NJR3_9RHOO|nr:hypothetical protein [Aromatoleum toluolicum]NMF99566.1 hypothetical protein [Aromatoleum toluolicum]
MDRPLRLVSRPESTFSSAVEPGRAASRPVFGDWTNTSMLLVAHEFLEMVVEREKTIDQKLRLLMEHFNIHPTDKRADRQLAIKLAELCVRGFQERIRPGAPKRWGLSQLSALKRSVDSIVAEGYSVRRACEKLFSEQGSDIDFPRCNSLGTMYRRYHQAKSAK